MQPGDIYLASFPFGDRAELKLRPVLLLTPVIGPSNEILTSYISSVIPVSCLPSDLILDPLLPAMRSTGLKARSVVRLHKLATIHQQNFTRLLGHLDSESMNRVRAGLALLLRLDQ